MENMKLCKKKCVVLLFFVFLFCFWTEKMLIWIVSWVK